MLVSLRDFCEKTLNSLHKNETKILFPITNLPKILVILAPISLMVFRKVDYLKKYKYLSFSWLPDIDPYPNPPESPDFLRAVLSSETPIVTFRVLLRDLKYSKR